MKFEILSPLRKLGDKFFKIRIKNKEKYIQFDDFIDFLNIEPKFYFDLLRQYKNTKVYNRYFYKGFTEFYRKKDCEKIVKLLEPYLIMKKLI